jgi:uncharacterized protein YycO
MSDQVRIEDALKRLSPSLHLEPGDCLLYKPTGIFGHIIAIKTWHRIAHVEVYNGNQTSWASRDGAGVSRYGLRMAGLVYVLRPDQVLDLKAARDWAETQRGAPYGWLDLLNFMGVRVDLKGIVCSPFVTLFYRHGGWNIFPIDDANRIAPFQFLSLVEAGFTLQYDGTLIELQEKENS